LRFDLHVPDVEEFTPGIEYPDLKVFMKGNEPDAQEYELSSRIVAKAGVSRTGQRIKGIEIAFDDDFANPGYADNRIGFGSGGFETFTLDIPDELRGKVSTLRFELGNGYKDEVYLDNVFFQSQHLQLGNPTDARIQYEPYPADGLTENHNDNRENFLVEKPQYTISYNDTTKNPKWVSWQLNRSWLGAESRTEAFEQDHTLPSNWDKVQGSGDINGNSDSSPLREKHVRGHLAPSGDRTRNEKDNYATFLMSNIVPQNQENNSDLPRARWWLGLEQFSRKLVQGGKELYIIAGGQGQKSTLDARSGDFKINVPERLWKVIVVMDKPGQTIADVDEGTMAFAIDIPNINPVDDPINPNDWKDYVIPVQTLENRLGTTEYDFLSNIPTEIQKKIESRDRNEILNWINSSNLSSPLLAAPDTSIGHDSFIKDNSSTRTGVKLFNSSQVNVTEVSVSETGLADSSIVKNSASEIDPLEITLAKTGIAEIDSIHITIPTKATFIHTSPTKTGKAQVSFIEPASNETGIAKISSVIDTSYNDIINPISSDKTLSSEIPFAPSVESEQFFSIHDSIPKITNVLNDTATNIWSDLLQTETQLDIDFQITDLPRGQLAEASITSFDDTGVPNAGTILIDHNANGVGWFVDSTPLDNSEFTAQDTDSYLLAAAESEASGKYDLLTTVLHELAHLYGFIDGYEGFDANVETKNGTTKFIGDDFEATLDGEHLDKQAHPNDLMNTHLAPGIRKLPSELDVKVLQAILKAEGRRQKAEGNLNAALSSDPLFAIANGDFSISDTTTWDTRGASDIEDIQAVLTEDSPFLSNFTQTFVEAGADLTIDEGSTVNLSGSFTDADTEDTHTVAWDLGNGEIAETANATPTYADGCQME